MMATYNSEIFTIQQNMGIVKTNSVIATFYNVSQITCFYLCFSLKDCCAASFDKESENCIIDKSGQWTTNSNDTAIRKYIPGTFNPGQPKDCSEIPVGSCSGKYTIYPVGMTSVDVYCDMVTDGGNWTVFQKRQDGSVDFFLDWNSYKNGFGNANVEFWIGNDNIHALTSHKNYQLRIELWDWAENTTNAVYNTFYVADQAAKYKLTIGGYSGTAGDSFSYQNNMKFSTWDNDNDGLGSWNCAQSNNKGGFWYNGCQKVNLNGRYRPFPVYGTSHGTGSVITWDAFRGNKYSLKRCVMMIRPV